MALQTTQVVQLGQILVTNKSSEVLHLPNVGASVVLVFYDPARHLSAVAHIILPDSALVSPNTGFGATESHNPGSPTDTLTAKFADKAIPALMHDYIALGGDPTHVPSVRLVGGAQMFSFGGGSASLLNVGARNGIAIQSALSRLGLPVHHKETGGNKIRDVQVLVSNGQIRVQQAGEPVKIID